MVVFNSREMASKKYALLKTNFLKSEVKNQLQITGITPLKLQSSQMMLTWPNSE